MIREEGGGRELRQAAFWFKAVTLVSDVWEKAANLGRE